MNADIEQIKTVEGMGGLSAKKKKDDSDEIGQPVRALSVRAFFDDAHNRAMIERLRAEGLNFSAEQSAVVETPIFGKLFVITGTLSSMGRDEAKKRIERLGGKTGSSVSSKTDYLVSTEEHSTKMDAARKLGTPIIGESEFLEMLLQAEKSAEEAASHPSDDNADVSDSDVVGDVGGAAESVENAVGSVENRKDVGDSQMSLGLDI